MRVLRAAIAVIRPRHDMFDQPVDQRILETILSFVPFFPAPLRWGLPFGLAVLEFSPPLFRFGLRRFSTMDGETAAAYLAAFEQSKGPFLLLFEGLRSLVLMSFYQQPEILRALEIGWQARADELTARRARLLAMSAELGNPKNAGRTYATAAAPTAGSAGSAASVSDTGATEDGPLS